MFIWEVSILKRLSGIMVIYDIAIVGGGPAGLSAALGAAKAGGSVILLEKDEAIGQNVRTSGYVDK